MTETKRQLQLHTMVVELVFDHEVHMDPNEIEAMTQRDSPSARLVDESPQLMISHDDFTHQYDVRATASIKTALIGIDDATEPATRDHSQTWDFPDAEEVLGAATSKLLVSELFGLTQSPANWMAAFSAVLRAAIELLRPTAVWAPPSQQFVRPEVSLENLLAAFVNVRMHNIEGMEESMLMDTLGLHVLRLPDLQCHFKGLDASSVANVLYNSAAYVLAEGDVIEDGNTTSGIDDND